MVAAQPEAARRPTMAGLEMLSLPREAAPVTQARALPRAPYALDLSRSRTHDAVLDILKAYKLSGNFHVNLDAVLKDMGIFDKVTYQIEPNPALAWPDRRHVVFRPNDNVPDETFGDLIKAIESRIGFHTPWWARLFRRLQGRAWLDGLSAAKPVDCRPLGDACVPGAQSVPPGRRIASTRGQLRHSRH